MKDRLGLEYDFLVHLQSVQLDLWGTKLKPGLIEAISAYVRSHNRPAATEDAPHQVYRGQDVIEIIRQWPDVQSPYPPVEV